MGAASDDICRGGGRVHPQGDRQPASGRDLEGRKGERGKAVTTQASNAFAIPDTARETTGLL